MIQLEELLFGGIGAACAGVITNPLEVIKTRVQLQGELRARGQFVIHYRNAFHAFYVVAKTERLISLQKGLVPALWYQLIMNGFRFGTYQMFDNNGFTRDRNGNVIIHRSIVASVCSSGIGTFLSNPFFLLKVHLQSRSNSHIAVGFQHSHSSMREGFNSIYGRHGVGGLWRGCTAAILRCSVGGSVQLTSFSATKTYINKLEIFPQNSWLSTLIGSAIGGLFVTTAMTPFDVIATRVFNQDVDPRTGKGQTYKGITDCIRKMWLTEGFTGFYKGFTISFLRLGPHTMLSIFFWQLTRENIGPIIVTRPQSKQLIN